MNEDGHEHVRNQGRGDGRQHKQEGHDGGSPSAMTNSSTAKSRRYGEIFASSHPGFLSLSMSDALVAVDAIEHVAAVLDGQHVVDELRVTVQASPLRHAAISRLDLNGVVNLARRKRERVEEAVVSLREPLSCEIMRQVTIVAGGDRFVA